MQSKPFYHSKTIWVSVAALISAIAVEALGVELTPEQILGILLAFMSLIGINLRFAQD